MRLFIISLSLFVVQLCLFYFSQLDLLDKFDGTVLFLDGVIEWSLVLFQIKLFAFVLLDLDDSLLCVLAEQSLWWSRDRILSRIAQITLKIASLRWWISLWAKCSRPLNVLRNFCLWVIQLHQILLVCFYHASAMVCIWVTLSTLLGCLSLPCNDALITQLLRIEIFVATEAHIFENTLVSIDQAWSINACISDLTLVKAHIIRIIQVSLCNRFAFVFPLFFGCIIRSLESIVLHRRFLLVNFDWLLARFVVCWDVRLS